ncbi:MAG: hypothetical protein CM15mV18_0750 [uncultured marine virus]|nr:MAG: hypothetical protein CM15mV18_0750 [uncultured marine virus]
MILISNEELEELGQIKVKQLKNRYNDLLSIVLYYYVDRSKMRLYDVEQSAQQIVDSKESKEKIEKPSGPTICGRV